MTCLSELAEIENKYKISQTNSYFHGFGEKQSQYNRLLVSLKKFDATDIYAPIFKKIVLALQQFNRRDKIGAITSTKEIYGLFVYYFSTTTAFDDIINQLNLFIKEMERSNYKTNDMRRITKFLDESITLILCILYEDFEDSSYERVYVTTDCHICKTKVTTNPTVAANNFCYQACNFCNQLLCFRCYVFGNYYKTYVKNVETFCCDNCFNLKNIYE